MKYVCLLISPLLFIVKEQPESSLPDNAHFPSFMDCNEGRSIQISRYS